MGAVSVWLLRAASVGREAALRLHIQGLTAACLLRTGGERPSPLVPDPGPVPNHGLVPDPVQATYGLETKEDVNARARTEKSRLFEEPFIVGVKFFYS